MNKDTLPIKSEPIDTGDEAGKSLSTSTTPPQLTRRMILSELQQQLDEFDWVYLKSNFEDKEKLIKAIMKSDKPHVMLSFLAAHFTAQTGLEMSVSFKKRLKQWQKEFKRTHRHDSPQITIKTDSVMGKLIQLIRNLFS